ncbi:histone acetyltransferase HAC12-like [Vicia villosa]|uniref:histone acetyltransferase HAC12-like n=1 Tax=Vicia villosa TaxID=3911 RepID=UPI00273BB794|nr:histone acetyltransferase HAC12-like [Vicia villosa]
MDYNSWFPVAYERKAYGTLRNYSPVFSDNIRKSGFDESCNQPVGFSTDWRDHPLRDGAASREEYMNLETLPRRAVSDNSKAHVTGYYSMPKGGQYDTSTVHDLPCFPDDRSSIPLVANMDVGSNLPVYGGESYLDANTRYIKNYFPHHQHTNNCDTDIQQPAKRKKMICGFSNPFPGWKSCLESQDAWKYLPQMLDFQKSSILRHDVNDVLAGNTEPLPVLPYSLNNDQWNNQLVQPYSSQTPLEVSQQLQFPPFSSINFANNGEELTNPMFHSTRLRGINNNEAGDTLEQIFEEPSLESDDVMEISSEEFAFSLKSRMRTLDMDPLDTGGEVMQGIAEFDRGITLNSNLPTLTEDVFLIDGEDIQDTTEFWTNTKKKVDEPTTDQETHTKCSNTTMHALKSKVPITIDVEDKHDIIGFNQEEKVVKRKVSDPKAVVDVVSLIDFFTHDQITEHINSLRKEPLQISTEDGTGIDANTCQLCEREKLYFSPVPIFCICCGRSIGRRKIYFCRKDEEFDAERCFCSSCYNASKGGCIPFNGTFVSKANLEKKTNDEVLEEPWVECNKCKRWQHQVCALYNNRKDLDCDVDYICAVCRLREIEDGVHVPLQKTTVYGAKDLPSTKLSDHLEKRLFKRLMEVKVDGGKVKGSENLDKVLAAESISIREVLSVDKQLKVKKQFLDIIPEKNYPTEFSYRLRVILLFQKIDGADICIFGLYVQEFGSECGNPNQRCVYISYLDSVKYFRPERVIVEGEALRTFVYHEILIGYLDFCKKRGFSTCHIWACPPSKRNDYILYCHPKEQKTPNNDKLRSWYLSMLKKATEEKIVVGLTNIYDHLFVPTEKEGSKVTVSRLPYFDGDFWCGSAMEKARTIEKESRGDYDNMLKKQVSTRALKTMGHVNPSKDAAKDILVMQKLGQDILPTKENFIVVHLQYSCIHCCEVIMSGKRWFCTECKNFQECGSCHSSNEHTLKNGEVHPLCQAVVDDIPSSTKHNDTILENGLFEDRNNFLSFCQKYQFQFDTLRRAKYSSMMILYHLCNPSPMTSGKCCSICCAHNVFQKCWKCEVCPDCTICSACYKDRGADCHEHKLTLNEHNSTQNELKLVENNSTSQSDNQESNGKMMLKKMKLEKFLKKVSQLRKHVSQRKKLLKLEMMLKHAYQCPATSAEPCSDTSCRQFKKFLKHAKSCTTNIRGGCEDCENIWIIRFSHSLDCKDSECIIQHCSMLKKRLEYRGMRSKS